MKVYNSKEPQIRLEQLAPCLLEPRLREDPTIEESPVIREIRKEMRKLYDSSDIRSQLPIHLL